MFGCGIPEGKGEKLNVQEPIVVRPYMGFESRVLNVRENIQVNMFVVDL